MTDNNDSSPTGAGPGADQGKGAGPEEDLEARTPPDFGRTPAPVRSPGLWGPAPYLVSFALWLMLVHLARALAGEALAPGPLDILGELLGLAKSGALFKQMGHTVLRALLGCLLANVLGVALGLLVGRASRAMALTAPLVAGLQSCPPIVWVSLVAVWAGTGPAVPVATVFAATLPFVFSNTAQGVMGLDRRLVAMSGLYDVPRLRFWRRLLLPSVAPYWLAGLSIVLGTGWKAAAVAEFLGSPDGVGAMIFRCYSRLDMEGLNAWALALVGLGVVLEVAVITPLRKKASKLASRGAA
ncbi:MAG: ABC transporter permease subunit [Deltaproteobacteria bacterium]|nr:ABC transporter permease subunit [Deltaproteobacteria bacterium]